MKVATYNVNSIRMRMPIVIDWLIEHEPDILAIQETKVEDVKFPFADIEEAGYHVSYHGQKSYNGLAIISREPLEQVRTGFEDPSFPEDCRIMMGQYGPLSVINTYVPNGTQVGTDKFEYKLRWLARFRSLIAERFRPTDLVVWLGDINIAPTPDDVYDSKRVYGRVGHHPEEFRHLEAIRGWGWHDCFRRFTEGPGHYTYFDYYVLTSVERNTGWRIDHIYASDGLLALCQKCEIDPAPRKMEKPSDHTPVWAEFSI
ncbi:MAG: exodeoxyribonuclease III [Fimbriimonadaceae bacterium]